MKLVSLAMAATLAGALPAAAQPRATARAETSEAPVSTSAVDGIMAAFQTHQLVGIGDIHGMAQLFDFWNALVRDPRFAKDVGNVVVEFGGAAHQDVMDRYLNGEDVSYSEFRKILSDTVGWVPWPGSLGYPAFLAQVRTVNMGLAPKDRIHVWLGEPAIDWSKIKTRGDFDPILATRDSHAADVVIRDILQKKRKALIIYGGAHFVRIHTRVVKRAPQPGSEARTRKFVLDQSLGAPDYGTMTPAFADMVRASMPQMKSEFAKLGPLQSVVFNDHDQIGEDGFDVLFANGGMHVALLLNKDGKIAGGSVMSLSGGPMLGDRIDAEQPGAMEVVKVYAGFSDKTCNALFAPLTVGWKAPGLVTPDPRTSLGPAFANCVPIELGADAMLYLGSPDQLLSAPSMPDTYLDLDFRREIARRMAITGGPSTYADPPKMENVQMRSLPLFP